MDLRDLRLVDGPRFRERPLESVYDFLEMSLPSLKYIVRPFFPLRVYRPTGIIVKASSII